MSHRFRIDYETRSRADLKKVGAAAYANHPSTRILNLAVSMDGSAPTVWVKKDCQLMFPDLKAEFRESEKRLALLCEDPESVVSAYNALFEIFCSDALWQKTFGFPGPRHSQWRCTMAKARRAGLPNSLGKCALALGLAQQKDTRGAALIRKFSIPQKTTGEFVEPEDAASDFRDFVEYCRQDVVVEEEIDTVLSAFGLKDFSLNTYQLDIDINTRGLPVNLDALRNADRIIDEETASLHRQFQEVAGLSPTQTGKVLQWVKDHGYEGDNLRAETLDEALEDMELDTSTPLGRALNLKKMVSYASLKKVKSMIACAGPHDNRVRGTLNYYGAGTGRWSASLIQPQNFKKPSKHLEKHTEAIYRDICDGCNGAWLSLAYGPPLECISSAIRHFIHDANGPFLDADYSAIEARIIAWQAQEQWRLDVFRTHGKIYEASAEQMFGTTLRQFDEYRKLNGTHHPHRQKGKVAELALGYQGGVGAMVKMGALKEGLTEDELGPIVKAWRASSPNIVQLWYDSENAAKSAVRSFGSSHSFGVGCEAFCATTAKTKYLFVRLPSGRRLAYPQPALEKQIRWVTVNKKTGEEVRHTVLNPTVEEVQKAKQKDPNARVSDALTYWGQIPGKATWGRISLYGGKIVENIVQGIAADVMAVGAHNAWKAGYEIVSLIHDEALAHAKPGQTIEEFVSLLTDMPAWADGLPLDAAGEEIPFYKKG